MFRTDSDYIRGINCLCIAAYRTNSDLLAYAFMSNHVHLCTRTENPSLLMRHYRYMYSRYFNAKYQRSGRLGEKHHFELELDGLHHILTAIAYILRNPMHHGVTATPLGYKYSSVSAVFSKELGRDISHEQMESKSHYLFLPGKVNLPAGFRILTCGMIAPDSVIDVKSVEFLFTSARTYLYYLNRLSGEKWEREQSRDDNGAAPITLSDIEQGILGMDIKTALANEHGRADYNAMTDTEICELADKLAKERYDVPSVYGLDEAAASTLADEINRMHHLPKSRLIRSLALARHRK